MDPDVDEALAQALNAARADLKAARADAAALTVLLGLRSRQYDGAWRGQVRAEDALADERARTAALGDALARARAEAAALSEALARERERYAAAGTVIEALSASLGWRGLDRRRFRERLARAGREAPDDGPGAARHAVLLEQGRRVLGLKPD